MCGIAGFFSPRNNICTSQFKKVFDALYQRGPDHSGALLFNDAGENTQDTGTLALLHTRLSIIDLSKHANQPLSNEDETLFLLCNGEIYNFKQLRNKLILKGHRFKSEGDAEVILHLYEEHGEAFLSMLEGMFAFALYDKQKNCLLLARDRFGKKPLVYSQNAGNFSFASTLRAMAAFPNFSKEIDHKSIEHYFCYRYMPAPYTGLKGVKKLKPGHLLSFSLETETYTEKPFWEIPQEAGIPLHYEEAKERFISLMHASIKERLVADVPVGLLLSGGVDSGTILALASQVNSNKLRTYTFGFHDKHFDESEPARQMAKHFGSIHTEISATENIQGDINNIVMAYDEPFADPSAIPSYYIAREAAKNVKVVLGGDGGDELFGGYKRYAIHARNRFLTSFPGIAQNGVATLRRLLPFNINKKSLSGKLRRILMQVESGYPQAYLMRMNNLDYLVRSHLLTSPLCGKQPEEDFELLYNKMAGKTPIEKVMNADCFSWLPGYILKKSDLSCMAHSLEGRHPFLSNALLDFALTLPEEYKLPHGGKRMMKESMKGVIPENILNRKKMGFSPPLHTWLKNELKERVEALFFSESSVLMQGNFFHKGLLQSLVTLHYSNKANFSEQIWMLLSLGIWMEGFQLQFKEASPEEETESCV